MAEDTITRAHLAEAVYQEVGLSRNESADLVEAVLNEMSAALTRSETVKISSFGSFFVRLKGQRIGRNPKTGAGSADQAPPGPGLPRLPCAQESRQRSRLVTASAPVNKPKPEQRRRAPPRRRMPRRPAAGTRRVEKSASAFRTISEVADELEVPQHVLRFWETKFPQVRPLKRGGGRRYYRPEDVDLLRQIRSLLYHEGYTIKGVQR